MKLILFETYLYDLALYPLYNTFVVNRYLNIYDFVKILIQN